VAVAVLVKEGWSSDATRDHKSGPAVRELTSLQGNVLTFLRTAKLARDAQRATTKPVKHPQ